MFDSLSALALGLVLLVVGAESLVRGSTAVARRLGVGSLVIGLTVVAFGTSAPELVVSVRAALGGSGDIAVGNVVGSNIANVLLILGVAALIRPLTVHLKVIRLDIPVMIGVTLLALPVLADREVGRVEGSLLLFGTLVYSWLAVTLARRDREAIPLHRGRPRTIPGGLLAIVLGLGALALGADLFVKGAVSVAATLGVSEALIGLTMVAVGTSLPEAATSIVAAFRGESDIAVGNIVGSNIFNLLAILGFSATVRPLRLAGVGWADALVMLVTALALLPLARSGQRLERWEAGVLLAGYVAYVGWRAGA